MLGLRILHIDIWVAALVRVITRDLMMYYSLFFRAAGLAQMRHKNIADAQPYIMIRTALSPEYITHSSILTGSHSPALCTLEVCGVHGL